MLLCSFQGVSAWDRCAKKHYAVFLSVSRHVISIKAGFNGACIEHACYDVEY